MTEVEWLTSRSLYDMLRAFPAKWDQRKLWLFGCACLRRHWHLLPDERTRRCVQLAEMYVDNQQYDKELDAAWEGFNTAAEQGEIGDHSSLDSHEIIRSLIAFTDPASSLQLAGEVAEAAGCAFAEQIPVTPPDTWSDTRTHTAREFIATEREFLCGFLRDIFGNPFRPVSFDPSWRTSTVVALAQQMYDSRDFSAMPILGDALQDAGCGHADILDHCRSAGPHVRGCWVVDLVLGKE